VSKYKVGDIVEAVVPYNGRVIIGSVSKINEPGRVSCMVRNINNKLDYVLFQWITKKIDCKLLDVLYY